MTDPKSALVIIDMQNDLVLPGAPACVKGAFATVSRIRKILNYFRTTGLPVFHIIREYRPDGSDVEITRLDRFLTQQSYVIPGTKGCGIVDDLLPLHKEYRIVKQRFSAFMNTELDFILRRLGVTHLIVCGTQYPNCVRTTIFDAVSYGYQVINITDATSAQSTKIAAANIIDIRNIGVECITTDEFFSALERE